MTTNESKHVDNGEVARRAYEIWESRGCPPGDGMDDWNAALAELLSAPSEEKPATAPREGVDGSQEGGIRVWFARVRRKLIRQEGG